MKAYIDGPVVRSGSVRRITQQLRLSAQAAGVTITPNIAEADLIVLHVIGRQDQVTAKVEAIRQKRQRYAVIQYCLRSTKRPHTPGWLPIWQGAATVWSYLNLPAALTEDGVGTPLGNFYYRPLGADASIFRYATGPRPYVICTSGQSALTESVREVCVAAQRVGKRVFHLGPRLRSLGSHVDCAEGMDDKALADLYGQCEFVSGLRRVEGFELPAAEGLLCGARPVLFDRPHYRYWYEPWGVFIPEGSRTQVIDSLEAVFRNGVTPVSAVDRAAAAEYFNWERIIWGFWDRCR